MTLIPQFSYSKNIVVVVVVLNFSLIGIIKINLQNNAK